MSCEDVDHDAPPQPGSITLEIQPILTRTSSPLQATASSEE